MEVVEFTDTTSLRYSEVFQEYQNIHRSAAIQLKEYLNNNNISQEQIVSISYSRVKTGHDLNGNPEFETSILLVHM